MAVSLLDLLFVRVKLMCWSVVFKSLSMRLLLVRDDVMSTFSDYKIDGLSQNFNSLIF